MCKTIVPEKLIAYTVVEKICCYYRYICIYDHYDYDTMTMAL